ncbi:MAG TPA: hypothetical protein PKC73_01165 [Dermatophilaceae bacterium]|jgi:hypothetical protein|nr:hypothetical protein [Dermatophilaceae bacterium]
MNNEALAVVLTVFMYICIVMLAVMLLVGILAAYLDVKVRNRIKRIESFVNVRPTHEGLDILKPRERLTDDEVDDIRAVIRRKKEQEARDADTIDKATEYRRDF